jgi:hypothetical protein
MKHFVQTLIRPGMRHVRDMHDSGSRAPKSLYKNNKNQLSMKHFGERKMSRVVNRDGRVMMQFLRSCILRSAPQGHHQQKFFRLTAIQLLSYPLCNSQE